MNIPKLPETTGPFLWGAVSGAIALAVVGFNWGGWVTGGTAERLATQQSEQAMIAALVPICVSQFQKHPEAAGRLVALKETKRWEQGDFVSAGGWATMPGVAAAEPNRQVAQACAEALTKVAQ